MKKKEENIVITTSMEVWFKNGALLIIWLLQYTW
jgi:hypothetical protein